MTYTIYLNKSGKVPIRVHVARTKPRAIYLAALLNHACQCHRSHFTVREGKES